MGTYVNLFENWLFESIGIEIAELRKTAKELREHRKNARERWAADKSGGTNSRLTSIEMELAKVNDNIRKLILQRTKEWENRGS